MGRRYALRDDQWDKIKNLLPGREGTVGANAKDNRIVYLLMQSSTDTEQEYPGEIYQRDLEISE